LEPTINSFIKEGATGINVTTPHKNEVVKYINEFTPEAEYIGSVNTIKIKNGKLIGHNTDAIGFENSLHRSNYNLKNKSVILFGAGGAARAVLTALIRKQCHRIVVCNRSLEKATKMVGDFSCRVSGIKIEVISMIRSNIEKTIGSSQLLVNATTVGMGESIDQSILLNTESLHRNLLVYDLIYRPYKTKLILQAEARNIPWINGIDMLILQGFESLKFWVERKINLEDSIFSEIKSTLRREICRE